MSFVLFYFLFHFVRYTYFLQIVFFFSFSLRLGYHAEQVESNCDSVRALPSILCSAGVTNVFYGKDILVYILFDGCNPFQDGLFWGCSRMGMGEKVPLPKICHTYRTMMKHGTVIPYLKKIQKMYESRDTHPEFC